MPFSHPNPPSGGSAHASWLRRLRDVVRAQKLVSGRGYRVKQTSVGTMLEIEPASGGGKLDVKRFRISEVHGDYFTCHTWDGTTEGEDDVYVAKPQDLRHSVTADELYKTEIIEGETINYTWQLRTGNLDGQRTATPDPDTTPSSAQIEIVIPVFQNGADEVSDPTELLAVQPLGGTGCETEGETPEEITWQMLDDCHAWCQVDA